MKRKRKRIVANLLALSLFFAGCLYFGGKQEVYAARFQNYDAVEYYETYGNQMTFLPSSKSNGTIFYATRAKLATSKTAYRTIGWKMTVSNSSGSKLQTLYFKLGGSYMYLSGTERVGAYEYNLYEVSLGQMRCRMNSKAIKALNAGKAEIRLDACISVVKNGKVQGAMNDSGPTSGKVYTTYSGITGAVNWSNATKQTLHSYFNKYVVGLFYDVIVMADDGITSVSGTGSYCYGTYLTVSAKVATGYEFAYWNGLERGGTKMMSFYVTESGRVTAHAEPMQLRIYYHRNLTSQDNEVIYQLRPYQKGGTELNKPDWKKGGKEPLGWAESANATSAQYKNGAHVSGSWMIKKAPILHLYAVWDAEGDIHTPPEPEPEGPEPGGGNPDPPKPYPPNPSPDPPGPTPPVEPEPDIPGEEQKPTPNKVVRCRFISSKYFEDEHQNLIPQEKGGLSANSVWVTDSLRRQILRCALRKS